MDTKWAKLGRGLTWYNGGVFVLSVAVFFWAAYGKPDSEFRLFLSYTLGTLWILGIPFTASTGFVLSRRTAFRSGKWINGLLFAMWLLTFCFISTTYCFSLGPERRCGG